MKDHDEIKSMLAALAGGELSAADRELVEQHLVNCPSCRAELAQLRLVVQVLRATPDEEPPPWLATRIMARVRENSLPQSGWLARLFLPLRIKLPLEALALVLICVTAWHLTREMDQTQQRLSEVSNSATPSSRSDHGAGRSAVPSPVPVAPASPKARTHQSGQSVAPLVQESPAFAPAPQAAPERTERIEQIRGNSENAPTAPAPAGAGVPVGTPAAPVIERNMAVRQKSAQRDGRLEVAAAKPFRLRLVVDDEALVSDKLMRVLQRLGGTVLQQQGGGTVVRIEKNRLPELFEQLAGIGRIVERPVMELVPDGWLELTVHWQVIKK